MDGRTNSSLQEIHIDPHSGNEKQPRKLQAEPSFEQSSDATAAELRHPYGQAGLVSVERTLRDLEHVYRKKIAFLQKSCKRAQLVFNLLSLLSIVLNLAGTIVETSMKSCRPKAVFCPNKIA